MLYVENVNIYDYNGLYSAAMQKSLPKGKIDYHKGQPMQADFEATRKGLICLWLRVEVDIELKPDHFPFIYPDSRKFKDVSNDVYLNGKKCSNFKNPVIKSNGKIQCTLAYPDYYCMLQNYFVKSIEFIDYCVSGASNKIFDGYISKFAEAKKVHKKGARNTDKKLLNTIYGLLCKNRANYNIIDFDTGEIEITKNKISYIHIGGYISAWARYIWIQGALKMGVDVKYGDTDSYHTPKEYSFLKLGEEIGELKIEHKAKAAYYYKKKTYLLFLDDGTIKITKAGTDRTTIANLETIIHMLYHGLTTFDEIYTKAYDIYKSSTGFDVEKFNTFMYDMKNICETGEYDRLEDVIIPVLYKHKTKPFYYETIIRWEKFARNIIEE